MQCKPKYVFAQGLGGKKYLALLSQTFVWFGVYFNPLSFESISLKLSCCFHNRKSTSYKLPVPVKFQLVSLYILELTRMHNERKILWENWTSFPIPLPQSTFLFKETKCAGSYRNTWLEFPEFWNSDTEFWASDSLPDIDREHPSLWCQFFVAEHLPQELWDRISSGKRFYFLKFVFENDGPFKKWGIG